MRDRLMETMGKLDAFRREAQDDDAPPSCPPDLQGPDGQCSTDVDVVSGAGRESDEGDRGDG